MNNSSGYVVEIEIPIQLLNKIKSESKKRSCSISDIVQLAVADFFNKTCLINTDNNKRKTALKETTKNESLPPRFI